MEDKDESNFLHLGAHTGESDSRVMLEFIRVNNVEHPEGTQETFPPKFLTKHINAKRMMRGNASTSRKTVEDSLQQFPGCL